MTDKVICYGTAWVVPVYATKMPAPDAQPPRGAPHVTSPRLDSSFMANFFIHSTGKTRQELLAAAPDQTADSPLLQRVGGSPHTSSRTYHLYDCGDRFCQSISALTEERIREIATQWRAISGVVLTPTTVELPHPRLQVLTRLVELARTAVANGAPLRLRVDYRGRKSPP